MKRAILAVSFVAVCVPASAQFGGITDGLRKAQEAKQKFDDVNVTEAEERKIGEGVSAKIRQRFGVVQDPAVHAYVSKVGLILAHESERPTLAWSFIVLDTDGVNAFASPGGLVHITRGALGLIKNEAELAGVLGHEVGHVAHKHALNAIKKNKAVRLVASESSSGRAPFLEQMENQLYVTILENSFDRGDELDADKQAVQLTQKAGYAAGAVADFLARLDDRNKDQPARNGLFASHPETKERIEKVHQLSAVAKTSAIVEARYRMNITYQPTALTTIAAVADGSAGITGSGKNDKPSDDKPSDDKTKPEEKKKGFGVGNLKQTVVPEKQNTQQVSASGGARGIGLDRAAKGGSNPNPVTVTVSAADLDAFRKGIV